MTSLELRVARLTRFGFTRRQAFALAHAGYDVAFVLAAAVGL